MYRGPGPLWFRPQQTSTAPILSLALLVLFSGAPRAQKPHPQGRRSAKVQGKAAEVKGPSLEEGGELLLFQDIPLVVSAGREAVAPALSPAPVSVLTGEEIEWSGLTRLPEILRFLPGLDVTRIDRLRYAVGVRGLHSFAADRTLALIDGRNATHPAWGGTLYDFLPVMVEEIERIEVVRGPIGAAWGANAFNGLVNIITKKPHQTQGLALTETVDEYGDNRTYLRWGSSSGDLFWRVSGAYSWTEPSSDAMTGESLETNDSNRKISFSGRGEWRMEEGDTFSFGVEGARNRTGDFPQLGYWPRKKGWANNTRVFLKREFRLGEKTKAYVQAFFHKNYDEFPSGGRFSSAEYDVEGQASGEWIRGHKFTAGGNLRFITLNPRDPRNPQEMTFRRDYIKEYWAGLFCSDTWTLDEARRLDLQLRGDQYSETGLDWSARASWIQAIEKEDKQVLRFSLARSFRAPLSVFRQMSMTRLPLGGGIYAYHLQANPDLDNEEIYSIEAGYTARPRENLTIKIDTYYQFLDDLINADVEAPTIYVFHNSGRAKAYGGEVEAEWTTGPARLGAWYGYHGFHAAQKECYRSNRPPDHTAGAKALVDLSRGFHLACFYRYSDAVRTPTTHHLPVLHTVDLTLGKTFLEGRASLQLGAADLFNRTDPKVYGLGNLVAYKTPGRTFFARFTLHF